MNTKRHAKPTSAQLVARIYRHQLAMHSEVRSALHMLSERLTSVHIVAEENNVHLLWLLKHSQTIKTLADHCARLLREKESVMKAAQGLQDANAYMSYSPFRPPPKPPDEPPLIVYPFGGVLDCKFKPLHRLGIRCAVCGELELDEASYDAH